MSPSKCVGTGRVHNTGQFHFDTVGFAHQAAPGSRPEAIDGSTTWVAPKVPGWLAGTTIVLSGDFLMLQPVRPTVLPKIAGFKFPLVVYP